MLSVCIPVYNCDLKILVGEILHQSAQQKINIEIVLIDDHSETVYHQKNKLLSGENIQYIRLEQNIGRARIRNLFLKYAKYPYLLFFDCDSKIIKPDFLQNYLSLINKDTAVVCGGRSYQKIIPQRKYRLRYVYGINRECMPASVRNQNPYRSFLSNNFLIKKEILRKFPFDEQIIGYGHEDTLFGYCLKQNHIPVLHIDNSVEHDFDETNEEFIKKTEQAIENLIFISKNLVDSEFADEVKLFYIYKKIKKYYLTVILSIIAPFLLRVIKIILIKSGKSLFLFDIYKLIYLSRKIDQTYE